MAAETIISASPSYVLVKAQDNLTVAIVLTDGPAFALFEVTLNYDTTAVTALNGNLTIPWDGQLTIDNNAGTVMMTGYNGGNPNQTLALIEFQALSQGNTTLYFTDTYIDHSPVTTESGVVEVVGPLNLSVASPRRFYYVGINITICGNATSAGSPINTLVGLELMTPHGNSLIRTVASGSGSLEDSWLINITSFYPSDNQGNHVSGFASGSQAYFTFQMQNTADIQMNYLALVDVLDVYNASIGQTWTQGIILAGGTVVSISGINIPSGTYSGSATAYVEVFSDWPHNNGVPYCPEQSVTFTITGGSTKAPTRVLYSNMTFTSCYQDAFNLASSYNLGNYAVYATMEYRTFTVAANTTFLNTVLCDFDGNGKVDIFDLSRFLRAYGGTPKSPKWFPEADLDLNGKVDIFDVSIFIRNYGKHI